MLGPREYAFFDPAEAEAVGLERRRYGALLCLTDDDTRVTAVGDPGVVESLVQAGLETAEVVPAAFATVRPGWPDDWPRDRRIEVVKVEALEDGRDALLCICHDGEHPDHPAETPHPRRACGFAEGLFADGEAQAAAGELEDDETELLVGWPEDW